MFNSLVGTQTPTVQYWDFTNAGTGTKSIGLEDDCAPIQVFATGGSTTSIKLYLPKNYPNGKTLTIVNQLRDSNNQQSITVFDSVKTSATLITLGGNSSITLAFINQTGTQLNSRTSTSASGWISISPNSINTLISGYNGTVLSGDTCNNNGGNSVIAGGISNTITSVNAGFIGGGDSNSLSSGANTTVSGGTSNTASGAYATIAGGQSNTASGLGSTIAGGSGNTAAGAYSSIVGGYYATTRGIIGMSSLAACQGPVASVLGVSQTSTLILGIATTDATATALTSDGSAVATNNQIILPNNSAFYFKGSVISNVTGAGNTKAWTIEGAIKRGANAASTVLVGTPTITSLYADAGAATWTIGVTADTTRGGVTVTFTGAAATTIRTVCKMTTTEVTY